MNTPALVEETGGAGVVIPAQDLLDVASKKLLEIAAPAPFFLVRRHLERVP